MSRSYRKNPIYGLTTSESESWDKKQWHSKWKSKVKIALKSTPPDEYLDIYQSDVSNTWDFAKDGKSYWPEGGKKARRK